MGFNAPTTGASCLDCEPPSFARYPWVAFSSPLLAGAMMQRPEGRQGPAGRHRMPQLRDEEGPAGPVAAEAWGAEVVPMARAVPRPEETRGATRATRERVDRLVRLAVPKVAREPAATVGSTTEGLPIRKTRRWIRRSMGPTFRSTGRVRSMAQVRMPARTTCLTTSSVKEVRRRAAEFVPISERTSTIAARAAPSAARRKCVPAAANVRKGKRTAAAPA
jgi:hypothetical protein